MSTTQPELPPAPQAADLTDYRPIPDRAAFDSLRLFNRLPMDLDLRDEVQLESLLAPERALWGLLVRTVDIGGGEKAAYSSYPHPLRIDQRLRPKS